MTKKIVSVILISLLISPLVFAEYDKAATQAVMRQNVTLLGQISQAAAAKDYAKASASLKQMSEGMTRLLEMTPPKGSEEQWETTLTAFLDAVKRGITASDKKDSAGLNAAVNDIKKYQQEGHSRFRG